MHFALPEDDWSKAYAPPRDHEAHAIVAELSSNRRYCWRCCRGHGVPISIATFIRLRLGDVFAFLIAHDERHMQQALRNLPVSPGTTVQAIR